MVLMDANAHQKYHHTGTRTDQQGQVKQAREQQSDQDSHQQTVDDGNHARCREENLPPGYSNPDTTHDTLAIIMRGKDEIGLQLRSSLYIQVTNTIDATRINDHNVGTLNYPLKGDNTHKEERGKQDEAEDEKGCAQARELSNKRKGNQGTG